MDVAKGTRKVCYIESNDRAETCLPHGGVTVVHCVYCLERYVDLLDKQLAYATEDWLVSARPTEGDVSVVPWNTAKVAAAVG